MESPSKEVIYAIGIRSRGARGTDNVSMSPRSWIWSLRVWFLPLLGVRFVLMHLFFCFGNWIIYSVPLYVGNV